MLTSLTKENFWDALYKKYPGEVQCFCDWIDKYKAGNNWNKLFNSDSNWQDADGKNASAPKFHDLPLAMQFGIFLQFVAEQKSGCLEFYVEDPAGMEKIPELIEEYFFYEHDDAVREHQEGKYMEESEMRDMDRDILGNLDAAGY